MSSSSARELLGILAAMALFLDAVLPFPEVDLVFFGISICGAVASVRDRREYVEVLGRVRLTGADTEVTASSSEFSSGAARFLPLASLAGSLMVNGPPAGNVERRALLPVLGVSSETSFPFPFDVVSRVRFEDEELDGWDCSARSLSFSFAALTLALERSALVSRLVVGVELDDSPGCDVASFCWVESI